MDQNFFDEKIILENNIVRLEPLEEKHFKLLLPVALHPDLWRFIPTKINTEQDFRKYFDNALLEKQNHKAYPFAYFNKQTNEYVGCTRYGNIEFAHKRLEIGWTWLHPNLHGIGFNKNCKFLLLIYGFEKLKLNRIELKTNSLNLRSLKAMQKIGAVKEGVFRSHMVNDDGTIRDTVYLSFIKQEWNQTKEKYFKGCIG